MKKIILTAAVLLVSAFSAMAQYNSISFVTTTPARLVQIDEGEDSNILYFTYTAKKDMALLCYNAETAFVRIPGTYKKYKCKDIAGIGDCSADVISMVRKQGGELNFAIEFEKFPLDRPFDIMEGEEGENLFNFTSVCVDMEKKGEIMPADDFLAYATAPRTGHFYNDGSSMRYWSENGLVMTMHCATSSDYGRFFKIYLEVANNTGRAVDFITSNITVQAVKGETRVTEAKVLSYGDFDTKVVNTLGWRSAPSTPASTLSDQFRWMAKDQANSGSVGAAALFGVISLAASATVNSQDEANFQKALEGERDRAVSNYLRSNTLQNGVVYGGFVAVKDTRPDQYNVTVKISNKEYSWTFNYPK